MSRLTGPRVKILRALDAQLPGLSRKSNEKRPFGPGQHGPTKRKKMGSPYALRLREKQKVRFNYGLTEKALRRVVEEALRRKENTGQVIIELLERRLDNVLFRAGFAATIPAARQLATHGHVVVNGRRETIPSRRLVRGDLVSIRPQSRDMALRTLESGAGLQSPWLDVDRNALVAKLTGYPDAEFLPFELSPRLIIEHYSRVL